MTDLPFLQSFFSFPIQSVKLYEFPWCFSKKDTHTPCMWKERRVCHMLQNQSLEHRITDSEQLAIIFSVLQVIGNSRLQTVDLLKGKSQPLVSTGTTLKGCSKARHTRAEAWQASRLAWRARDCSQRCCLTVRIPHCFSHWFIKKPQETNMAGVGCQQARIIGITFGLPGYR